MVEGINQVGTAVPSTAANIPPPAPDPDSFDKKIQAATSSSGKTLDSSPPASKSGAPASPNATANSSPAASASDEGGSSTDVHIPVSVLQTKDKTSETATREANGTDFGRQASELERIATGFIRGVIQFSDTAPPSPQSIDPEILSRLASYGFKADANGEIHLGDPSANGYTDGVTQGFFLALATTAIGDQVAPDISNDLLLAGASADTVAGYQAGRAFTLARYGTPVDDGGPIIFLSEGNGDDSIDVETSEGLINIAISDPIPIDDTPPPEGFKVITVSFGSNADTPGQSVSVAVATSDAQRLFGQVGAGDTADLANFIGEGSAWQITASFATDTVIAGLDSKAMTRASDPNESETARQQYWLRRAQIPPDTFYLNPSTTQVADALSSNATTSATRPNESETARLATAPLLSQVPPAGSNSNPSTTRVADALSSNATTSATRPNKSETARLATALLPSQVPLAGSNSTPSTTQTG